MSNNIDSSVMAAKKDETNKINLTARLSQEPTNTPDSVMQLKEVTYLAKYEQLKTSTAMKTHFSPLSNKKVGFDIDENIIDV